MHSFKVGSTYSSFKTHASRKHPNWQADIENTVPFHEDPNELETPEPFGDHEQPASTSQSINNDAPSSEDDVPNGTLSIERTAALFLLTFKERYMLPQAAINFAVSAVNGIVTSACESIQQSLLTSINLPTDEISTHFEPEDPFASLQTEYQQTKFYRQVFGMVVSVVDNIIQFIISQRIIIMYRSQ